MGEFSPTTLQRVLTCPEGTAITHSVSSLKNLVEISYTFPSNFTSYINFRFTVMNCFRSPPCNGQSLFWANLPGPIISSSNFLDISSGCGISKGCIGANFDGCTLCNESLNCDIFVTWRQNLILNIIEFEIQSNTPGKNDNLTLICKYHDRSDLFPFCVNFPGLLSGDFYTLLSIIAHLYSSFIL